MKPDWRIRRARPGDANPIAALTDAAYGKYVPVLGRNPAPMDWDYDRLVAEWQAWVAEADERLVGVLLMEPESDANTLWVESVAVSPPRQGRGLGRALLDHAIAEASRQGHSTVRLYTNVKMTENIALYRRYGFDETKREGSLVYMSIAVPGNPPAAPVAPG